MNCEYDDFIGVYSDVFAKDFCGHLIDEVERHVTLGAGCNRSESEKAFRHRKDDYQLFYNGRNLLLEPFDGEGSSDLFFNGLQRCFEEYTEKYSILKEARLNAFEMKFQKTTEGGGYHIWHVEQNNGDDANRGLVYMLYLNTLPENANGETEFLYQKRRLSPAENTMVIWPAGFTHPHRGNPVYGDKSKYIITGWFRYE